MNGLYQNSHKCSQLSETSVQKIVRLYCALHFQQIKRSGVVIFNPMRKKNLTGNIGEGFLFVHFSRISIVPILRRSINETIINDTYFFQGQNFRKDSAQKKNRSELNSQTQRSKTRHVVIYFFIDKKWIRSSHYIPHISCFQVVQNIFRICRQQ